MAFPRKPVLDRVFVQVIPLESIFEQDQIEIPLEHQQVKVQSDRGIVVAVGDCVVMGSVSIPMPVKEGDIVYFDEFAYAGRFYLKPSDKYRKDLPIYLEIRVGDLHGIDTGTPTWEEAAVEAGARA